MKMEKWSTTNKVLFGSLITALLILVGMIVWNQNINRQSKNWEHNYRVMQDSIGVVTTKYGEVLYERGSLIIEKRELEAALDVSNKQVKEYEKKIGSKLAYIAKLEAQLKIKDTVTVTEVVHDTLSNSYTIRYTDEWFGFNERFSLENQKAPRLDVYDIWMNTPLKVGITDDYTIFVTSPNPYLDVSSIEGAVIDGSRFNQKPQRIWVGFYLGYGFQYGMINKQLDIGPQCGIGIGVRIF